jgi:hypothetical protein
MAIIFNLDKEEKEEPILKLPAFLGGGSFIGKSTTKPKEMEGIKLDRDVPEKEKAIIRGGSFQETRSEVDHIIPLALGGTNERENLQVLRNKKTISQTVYDAITGKERLPFDYKPKNRQEGKMLVEWEAIDKYKSGEISLAEARGAVINWENPEVFLHKEVKPIKVGVKDVLKEIFPIFREIEMMPPDEPLLTEPKKEMAKHIIQSIPKAAVEVGKDVLKWAVGLPFEFGLDVVSGIKELSGKEPIKEIDTKVLGKIQPYSDVAKEKFEQGRMIAEIMGVKSEAGKNVGGILIPFITQDILRAVTTAGIYGKIGLSSGQLKQYQNIGSFKIPKTEFQPQVQKQPKLQEFLFGKKPQKAIVFIKDTKNQVGFVNIKQSGESVKVDFFAPRSSLKPTKAIVPTTPEPPGFMGKPPIVTPPPATMPSVPPTTPKPTIPKPPIPMPTPAVTPIPKAIPKDTTQSIQQAKAEGKSFDEWVEGQIKNSVSLENKFVKVMDEGLARSGLEGQADVWRGGVFREIIEKVARLEVEGAEPQFVMLWENQIKEGMRPKILTVLEDGVLSVVDGNHKLQAYKNLGIEEVPTIQKTTKPQLKAEWDSIKPATLPTIKKALGVEPAPFVRMRETTVLKERIKTLAKGVREGAKITKETITNRLNKLNTLIRESNLTVKDKAKFIFTPKQIAQIKKQETFNKKVDDIVTRIETLEKTQEHRQSISNLRKTIKKLDIKRLRPEFKTEIKSLLEDVDTLNTSEKKLSKLSKTKEFLLENPDNLIPEKVINSLDKLEQKQLRDLSTNEINQLNSTIGHLQKLNQLKNKLIVKNKIQDAKEIIKSAIERVNTKPTKKIEDPNTISSEEIDKKISAVQKILSTDSYGVEDISEILDRTKTPYGLADIVDEVTTGEPTLRQPISEIMYRETNRGTTDLLKLRHEIDDFLKQGLDDIVFDKKGEAWSRSFVVKDKDVKLHKIKLSGNRTLKLNSAKKISLYLHSLRNQSKRHLLNGGFSFEKSPTKIHKLTESDLNTIKESMTENEMRVANKAYEFFNVNAKDIVNKTSVELNGFEIAIEDNYIPIRTNAIDKHRDNLKLKENLTPESMHNFFQTTLEGMGIFKETTNATNAIILEDIFKTIESHKIKVTAYSGLANSLRNMKNLVYDKDFRISVTERFGQHYWNGLRDFITDIEQTSQRTDNIEKLTQDLMNKLDVAILGANPWVMAKQPVSYILANIEIDAKYLMQPVFHKKQVIEEMMEHSPQMRDRIEGNVTRELGEVANVGQVRKTWTGKTPISNKIMSGIRWADMEAVGRIWQGVKKEVSEQYPNLTEEQYWNVVSQRHEQVVHRTQPTFLHKDRSKIARSKNFVRILTKYSTIRNRMFRRIRTQIHRYNMSDKTIKDKVKLTKNLSLLTLVSSLLIAGIDEARIRFVHKEKSTPIEFLLKTLSSSISLIYFVGDIFSSLISKVQRGTFGGWDMSNPVSSFLDNAIDFLAELGRTIEQAITKERYKSGEKAGEEKWKTSMLRMTDTGLDVGTKFKGIPYKNIQQLVKGFIPRDEEEYKLPEPSIKLPGLPELPELPKLPKLPSL